MAWTDQCKIDARKQVDHRKEQVGGVRKALRQLSKESGISYPTLRRWYYEDGVLKDENAQPTSHKNQATNIRTVAEFKKRRWSSATESLKRIDASLSRINGSSSDSLKQIPVAVLRNFLNQFSRLQEYADAAEQRVNDQSNLSRDHGSRVSLSVWGAAAN